MKAHPKVTIIIPVYNTKEYLRECLDSVCNQTYTNLEIICIDDGSTDGSLSILREYADKDKRIILVAQKNSGQAAARNVALKMATGEWVGGVDSDDYLDAKTIEKAIDTALKEDVEIVHYGFKWFSDSKVLQDGWTQMKHSGKIKVTEDLIPKLFPHFVDKLWKRALISRYDMLFPEGLHFEDLCFTWQLMSMVDYIYCLPEKLYYYRFRENGTMGNYSQKHGGKRILDFLKLSDICLSFWRENNIREKFNSERPVYLELEVLNRSRDRIIRWAAPEFQHEAWVGIRGLIDKYGLGSRLSDFPDLALYYHLPPYAHVSLKKILPQNSAKPSLNKDMILLINERRIYWSYRRVQLMAHLTWGKKREKYQAKKRHYKELLRRCRQLRKQELNALL